jgi:hypothetical protein
MHAEHADSIRLNDLSGHVLATRSPCSIRWASDAWKRSMRTRWHMNRAGACLGEGRGPIGCATLWRQGALRRRGGRRVFVDGKPHRTICVFRVHRLPLSALKPCLLLQWFKHPVSSARGQGASSRGSGNCPTACTTVVQGGPHACLDPTPGRALGAARSRKERGGRLAPAQASVAAGTAHGAASGGPENVIWLLAVS